MNAVILDITTSIPRRCSDGWGVWCLNEADHSWEFLEPAAKVEEAVRRARELRRLATVGRAFSA